MPFHPFQIESLNTVLPLRAPPNPSAPSTNDTTPKPVVEGWMVLFDESVVRFAFWIVLLNEPFVTRTALFAKPGVAFMILRDRTVLARSVVLLPSMVTALTAESK